MSNGHYNTSEWLLLIIDTLAEFRRDYPVLVGGCQPVVRRIVQGRSHLEHWLQCGDAEMALHRAQLFTSRAFGHYAPHRVSFACP